MARLRVGMYYGILVKIKAFFIIFFEFRYHKFYIELIEKKIRNHFKLNENFHHFKAKITELVHLL